MVHCIHRRCTRDQNWKIKSSRNFAIIWNSLQIRSLAPSILGSFLLLTLHSWGFSNLNKIFCQPSQFQGDHARLCWLYSELKLLNRNIILVNFNALSRIDWMIQHGPSITRSHNPYTLAQLINKLENGAPGGNTHGHRENMQVPHG